MKKGLWLSALIAFAFIAIAGTASAQFSFGNYAQQINISELAESQAVNFFLVFLLVFAFVLLVLKDVFRQSYGSAVIISLVVGIMGSLGLLYYYGPIIPMIAPWIVLIALAVVGLIFWHLTKESANKKGLLWILTALSLLWFFWIRKMTCARLPGDTCFVIDIVAVAILIIAFFNLLFKLLSGRASGGGEGGFGGGRERGPVPILRIGIGGNGRTNPAPGDYRMRMNSRKKVVVTQGILDHWELDGTNMGRNYAMNVLMNDNHTLMAVFRGAAAPQQGGVGGGRPGGNTGRERAILTISKSGPGAAQGITTPGPGRYPREKNSIITIKAIGQNFDHWIIDNYTQRNADQTIRMDRNHTAIAVFGTTPRQGPQPGGGTPRPPRGQAAGKEAILMVTIFGKNLMGGQKIQEIATSREIRARLSNAGDKELRWRLYASRGLTASSAGGILGGHNSIEIAITIGQMAMQLGTGMVQFGGWTKTGKKLRALTTVVFDTKRIGAAPQQGAQVGGTKQQQEIQIKIKKLNAELNSYKAQKRDLEGKYSRLQREGKEKVHPGPTIFGFIQKMNREIKRVQFEIKKIQ